MLTRRSRKLKIDHTRYGVNPAILRIFELQFGKTLIVPGMKFKIKNSRGVFIFRNVAHNTKLDISWVDAMDDYTGEFRSFYLDRIKSVVKKPSRAKKT